MGKAKIILKTLLFLSFEGFRCPVHKPIFRTRDHQLPHLIKQEPTSVWRSRLKYIDRVISQYSYKSYSSGF